MTFEDDFMLFDDECDDPDCVRKKGFNDRERREEDEVE